jgi:hypothetical protein
MEAREFEWKVHSSNFLLKKKSDLALALFNWSPPNLQSKLASLDQTRLENSRSDKLIGYPELGLCNHKAAILVHPS